MNLRQQVDFWGGICLKDVAFAAGYSSEYLYMVLRGQRQSTKLLSAVFQAIERRKSELREALLESKDDHDHYDKRTSH